MNRSLAVLIALAACGGPDPVEPTPTTDRGAEVSSGDESTTPSVDTPPALLVEASGPTLDAAVAAARLGL